MDWQRYERWNAAIADVVYPPAAAGLPVYLDLEDGVLDSIRDAAEPDAPDASAALIEAVKGTLLLTQGPAEVLREHLTRLDRWYQGPATDPPPSLGLLALLSLAAENMHGGEGKAAHNFYGRVADLLDLDEHVTKRFVDAYRRDRAGVPVSKDLWTSVNDWLEMTEGNRGLPTAFAIGHAHVGFPLSQALVRRTDREKFGQMFTIYGLVPHSSLPSFEMEQLIAEWITRTPCPVSNSLARMWTDATARGRIVDVARLTLEAWDAPSVDAIAGAAQVDSVRIRAAIRNFPTRQLEISLVMPARSSEAMEAVEVLDDDGAPIASLDLVPASSGWLTLADSSDIDVASFLMGETRLCRKGQAQPLRRRPRRLIPMRRDDMLQAFVECERVQLGEDTLVLVRSEIAPKVAALLDAAARPGFIELDSLPGLPEGWSLFDRVQILSSIPTDQLKGQLIDLNLLQPLATSQVVLQGGMRLPGNIRKWSSALPPELRATSGAGAALSARITCIRPLTFPRPPELEKHGENPVMTWDLAEELLPDGDYLIEVIANDGSPSKPETLRLRSADHPAIVLEDREPIANLPGNPEFGLVARRMSAKVGGFRGAPEDDASIEEMHSPRGAPSWYSARQRKPSVSHAGPKVIFPGAGEHACIATGAHYMQIESAFGGEATVEGVCKYCGIVRRFPTRPKQKRTGKGKAATAVAPRVDVSELESVKAAARVDWQAGFDAVCHVGSGPMSALERIALQMESSGLFGDIFARRLEILGHIEVERDPHSLLATSWEVIEPTLIGLADGDHVLIGFRSDRMMVAIEDFLHTTIGDITIDRSVDAPSIVRIVGVGGDDIELLMLTIEEATGKTVAIAPNAAESLAARLPPLSRLLTNLPVIPMPGARGYEHWDPTVARFEPASDGGRTGAFRLKGFSRAYIYRRPDDVGSMTAILGDARIVKYAAALDAKQSLIGYDAAARVLYVPLGADLPGLYGRAAALASGCPPVENTAERLLEYRGVPSRIAGQLTDLMMS